MKVALMVYELAMHSRLRGEVWGEDIDAQSLRKAFLRCPGVEWCDILTMNVWLALKESNINPDYDLVIHFFDPSLIIPNAVNVLLFQQFYNIREHDFSYLIKLYDKVFTPSKILANEFPGMVHLPLAVDAELYAPSKARKTKLRSDVLFIGNAYIRDVETYDKFLEPATRFDLAIFGNRWQQEPYHKWLKHWRGVLDIEAAPRAYSATKIALSIHNREHRERYGFVTARPYHALACGVATVSDGFPALEELLPQKESGCLQVMNQREMEVVLEWLIKDDKARQEMGRKGRDYILRFHTWDIRVGQMLDYINCPC